MLRHNRDLPRERRSPDRHYVLTAKYTLTTKSTKEHEKNKYSLTMKNMKGVKGSPGTPLSAAAL